MPEVFRITGLDEFKKAALVLREAGGGPAGIDGDIKKQLLKELRLAGKPAALAIRAGYRERMPHRGGLAERLAGARVGVRTRVTGQAVNTSIVTSVSGWDLDAIESGSLRHPVYGNKTTWVTQDVPANVAGDAFEAIAPEIDVRVNVAVEKVIASVEARI